MKKRRGWLYGFLSAVVLVALLGASQSIAPNWPGAQSSGLKKATAMVKNGPGWLTGIQIITNGLDNVTITMEDSDSSASGTSLFQMTIIGPDYYGGKAWTVPVRFEKGLYAVASGTTPQYIVDYID